MEILALYTSPDVLGTALTAGARHLAALCNGFALVLRTGAAVDEPDGWAGFTCAADAQVAARALERFREETAGTERPLRTRAPSDPARVWSRAAGGVYGFPLRYGSAVHGVALLGVPGEWPRVRASEIESVLCQLALVLDHAARSAGPPPDPQPADELLRLSEQLLAQDVELMRRDEERSTVDQLRHDLIEKMSFELRAPLNSMIERVISVLASEHESLSQAARGSLREVLDDGQALLRMLQNILDLWRLRQSTMRLEIQDVNLAEVTEEALFNVRDRVRPGVVLEKRLQSPLPKVRTDLTKLNQILFHLLDNAAKFTHRGRIEFAMGLEGCQLVCSVTDTGIGIAADDQREIFDEFFQVDSTPGAGRHGSGLGLTLARGLIERLDGTLGYESEIGRGSCFRFTLPVGVV
jgi:signal transduction histidine kinase